MEIISYLQRVNGSGHIVEHVGFHESGDYLLRQLFSREDDKPYRQHKYEVEKEYNVIDKAEVDKLERQTCGRRGENGMDSETSPFVGAGSNRDHWRNNNTCSYCGSLRPSEVINLIKEKGFSVIERSDKSYKWYINSHANGHAKYYRAHDTKEFIEEYNELVRIKRNDKP